MHFYRQTDLFNVLISAAQSPILCADPALQAAYNKKRFSQVMRALRSRNIFLYTEGARTSTDLNNANTIYTQPAGERLLVLGYSDNFRYGRVTTATAAGPNPATRTLLEMHKVRIVGRNERALVEDFVPAQAGVSGQPRYTNIQLTVPTILEPDEQIAVDLGYDQAGSAAAANTPPQAFIFFTLRVRDKLTGRDEETIREIKRFIEMNCFQRAIYLNCGKLGAFAPSALGASVVGLNNTSAAGAMVSCDTPLVSEPTLITGIGTSLGASKITITDSADGHSFSLNRAMQSSALNMPDYEDGTNIGVTWGAPVVAPIWENFFKLPVPHLLIRGASLHAEIVNGGDAGAGTNTILEEGVINQLLFQGITV